MIFSLAAIEKQCNAWGRIDAIQVVDPAEVSRLPTRSQSGTFTSPMMLVPGATAKTISATAYTAEFDASQEDGQDAGDYFISSLSCSVSLGRKALDDILWRIGDSYVHILFTDSLGVSRWLLFAQVFVGRRIPSGLGGRNEYTITFRSKDLWPAGIITSEEIIDNEDGEFWSTDGGSAWTSEGGDQWWTD